MDISLCTIFTLIILLTTSVTINAESQGHLQKLGLQRQSEGHIDILKELPSPIDFFEKYITPGRPAVFKDAAKQMPAFSKWDDEYLRTNFAHLKFDVEEGKKENRSQRTFVFSMKDFVDKYKTEDVYMVHSIQKEMREDVTLLPTLTCGGYANLLQDIVMWFSSGGTKSVLHSDNVDNINCLLSGEKELYMVDKKYEKYIEFDAPDGGYSRVDPDAVDLKKYPGISHAPWWEAKMEAGDCLFIPLNWFHQVRSYNRNIAVNVWFTHPLRINVSDCDDKTWKDNYAPLVDFQLKSNEGARQYMALEVKEKGKMSKRQFHKFLTKGLYGSASQIKEILKLVNKNDNQYVTMEDIDALTTEDLKKIRQLMPMGADMEDEGPEDEGSDEEGPDEQEAREKNEYISEETPANEEDDGFDEEAALERENEDERKNVKSAGKDSSGEEYAHTEL